MPKEPTQLSAQANLTGFLSPWVKRMSPEATTAPSAHWSDQKPIAKYLPFFSLLLGQGTSKPAQKCSLCSTETPRRCLSTLRTLSFDLPQHFQLFKKIFFHRDSFGQEGEKAFTARSVQARGWTGFYTAA